VYGTVRTVVWEDGGREAASYPILRIRSFPSPPPPGRTVEKPWGTSLRDMQHFCISHLNPYVFLS